MSDKDKAGLFGDETLSLIVNGEEFSAFLEENKTKLLGKLEEVALREEQSARQS